MRGYEVMNKRKSKEQWMALINEFKASGLNLTTWCREKGICKSSIYPYITKFNTPVKPSEQKWGSIIIPRNVEASSISLKIGSISIDIKNGVDKVTLSDVLNVILKLC